MKVKIQILSTHGLVLFELEKEGNTLRKTVEDAVDRGSPLCGASLRGADLYGANLCEADLRKTDFREADLCGANLRGANLRGANLCDADLYGAGLCEADLRGANLRGASLREADLYGANLCEADLRGANLRGASLRGADLYGANNLGSTYRADLSLLRYQKGKLTAFKYVSKTGLSPIQKTGKILYQVGKTYTEKGVDTSELVLCGRGLNVATLAWCLREMGSDCQLLEVEFYSKDIAAIPYNTDGKFRVKRLTVVKKWTKAAIEKARKEVIK